MFGLLRYGVNIDGFPDYGPAYARMQFDWVREFLLLYYAHMAHIYSPGTWTSVESSKIDGTLGGPYCTPAQVTIPDVDQVDAGVGRAGRCGGLAWRGLLRGSGWSKEKKIAVTAARTRFGESGSTNCARTWRTIKFPR